MIVEVADVIILPFLKKKNEVQGVLQFISDMLRTYAVMNAYDICDLT